MVGGNWKEILHPPQEDKADNTQPSPKNKAESMTAQSSLPLYQNSAESPAARRERVEKLKHEQWKEREKVKLAKAQIEANLKIEKERLKQEAAVAKAQLDKERQEEKRKQKIQEEKDRLKKIDLQHEVIDTLNGSIPPYGKLKFTFGLWFDENEKPEIIKIDPLTNICQPTSFARLESAIKSYTDYSTIITKRDDYKWNDKQVTGCAKLWKQRTFPIPRPLSWAFKSNRALTFCRHPFDPDANIPTPTFDEMFSRMRDPETVLAWLGSCFVPKSYRQQYLVIQGDGGEGKGSLARVLQAIFKDEYFGAQEPPKNQFFGTMFAQKKIVCFQDLRDVNFYQSPILLGITGGDSLQLERKGVDVVNQQADCRLLILTNTRYTPKIQDSSHDLRRILWTDIKPLPPEVEKMAEEVYHEKLMDEVAGFVGKAIDTYKKLCPTPRPINQSEEIKEIIRGFSEKYSEAGDLDFMFHEFVYQNFVIYPTKPGQKAKDLPFVSACTVKNLVENQWPRDTFRYARAFKRWITDQGIKVGTRYMIKDKARRCVYMGLGLRNGRRVDEDEWVF